MVPVDQVRPRSAEKRRKATKVGGRNREGERKCAQQGGSGVPAANSDAPLGLRSVGLPGAS